FVCGAVVMVFELVGSRVIGPYVGTSTYAWTSLIGVILASLSIGYYAGGYLADKKPNVRPLALVILFSALAIAFSAFTKDIFSAAISSFQAVLEVKSIVISLILFAPASFFLGMVSPYAVRLRMSDVTKAGRTAGNLYAISTAGSILGTFLAGFYVIPNFGSTNSLMILSAVLLFMSVLLLWGGRMGKPVKAAIFLLIIFLGLTSVASTIKQEILVADVDTEYNRIWVFNSIDSLTGKPLLALATDPYGIQAAMFTDGTDDLVFDYTKFYRLFSHFVPNPENALMIGGGAYTYPRDFINNYPNAKMDVVEIDSGMTEIARKYFGLKDEKSLVIYHQDARIYLNENKKKYDVIFGDAFNSALAIPFQLTTKEAVRKEYDALNDGGVIMVNILSAIEGEKGKFARAEYATYKEVFPQTFLFAVQNANDGSEIQNIMLVALKSEKTPEWKNLNKETDKFLSQVWNKPIADDVLILTDDFAPVEYYKRVSLQE
ncbi:MAG: fused MFS/spermidine synthase, partial [Candidatus Doudnabacteria bacterium]|nr:fused MFS/spermidine synthase [Candidatus Doudnabacteria bacterium]